MATPARSSAADRLRPAPGDALVVLLVLCAALALLWLLRPAPAGELTVEVRLDGTLMGSYPLEEADAPVYVDVDAPWPLTLELDGRRVRISHSDCPSQDCVHTGWIDEAGEQIICLPNKLIISLVGEQDTQSKDFDVIVG